MEVGKARTLDDFSWIFICQSGTLEREACLLAASLRHQFGSSAKLTAAVPKPINVMGEVTSKTMGFLSTINVEIREFCNPLPTDPTQNVHLMMNKAYALTLDRDTDVTVFLDSDQICFSPISLSYFATPFFGRRAAYTGAQWMDGLWDRAFDICDARMPSQRLVSISGHNDGHSVVSPPYFNAGFLSVHRSWTRQLKDEYIECFQRLWHHDILGKARYFTEQVALSVAVAKIRIPYQIDSRRIDRSFLHYCNTKRLAMLCDQVRYIQVLTNSFPGLQTVLRTGREWNSIL